jgi:hypothetical protein
MLRYTSRKNLLDVLPADDVAGSSFMPFCSAVNNPRLFLFVAGQFQPIKDFTFLQVENPPA